MKTIGLWFRIVRPQTLAASLCPVMAALIAMPSPVTSATVAAVTIVCALALQILSNLINDYYDFVRGTDKKGRAGFKRALAEGEVSKRQMQWACLTALAVSVGCGLFLVVHGGWVILAIGITALLFAWLYTATSHSLSYLGVADIFVFLYYGVIASSGTYYLQTGQFAWSVWCAGGVSGLISMCVLLINNLRDMDSDRLVGKRTFPVRFGRRAALCLMGTVVTLMPVLAYLALGWSLAMLVVVPAAALFAATIRAKGATYNKLLMAAGIINIIYVVLMAVSRQGSGGERDNIHHLLYIAQLCASLADSPAPIVTPHSARHHHHANHLIYRHFRHYRPHRSRHCLQPDGHEWECVYNVNYCINIHHECIFIHFSLANIHLLCNFAPANV